MVYNNVVRTHPLTGAAFNAFADILCTHLPADNLVHSNGIDCTACLNFGTAIEIDFNPMIRFFPSLDVNHLRYLLTKLHKSLVPI